jgi:hypothetical protein
MSSRQTQFLKDDLARSARAKSLSPADKMLVYRLNADYRLAEQPDTARLVVREMHDMLTPAEARRLHELRAAVIHIGMMCDSMWLSDDDCASRDCTAED